MQTLKHNWAGNLAFSASGVHQPETLDEIRRLVASSRKVKAVGSCHSFSTVGDTSGDLISMERFNRVVGIDPERNRVTVEAGIPYGTLCAELHAAGYAINNMASLPQISVAGACATATHGSGDNNGNLATTVAAITLVTADGEIIELDRERDGEEFRGAVVGLGGLGVVAHLSLDIESTYVMRQDIYEGLPFTELHSHFDEIMSQGYSVSIFTDWRTDQSNQVWVKQRVDAHDDGNVEQALYGARLSTIKLHPVASKSPENCTEQLGILGPWHERLTHFRMDSLPSAGNELQTEYFVPRRHARAALHAVSDLREEIAPVLHVSEIRTVAADELWMSPMYERACAAIHFTWKPGWPAVREILPLIEDRLRPLGARPHWGKLFTMSPDHVQSLYPRISDFRALLTRYDPAGKLRNNFLDEYIVGDG